MKTMIRYRLAQFFSRSPSLGPPLSLRLAAWHTAKLHSLLAVASAISLAHAASAQTWTTVDDFQYSPGKNAWATGLAKDPAGTIIYAAGDAEDALGVFHGLAFKSNDGGTNWSLMDDFSDPAAIGPNGGPGYDAGIASDTVGNLYASGYESFPSGGNTWLTRRSVDGGTNWSTVDALSGGNSTYPTALAADSSGSVYVVGETTNASTIIWLVRKGTVNSGGGISWANVDAFSGLLGHQAYANGVFCHPTAGVFVVGQRVVAFTNKGGFIYGWTVRQSQDGGAT